MFLCLQCFSIGFSFRKMLKILLYFHIIYEKQFLYSYDILCSGEWAPCTSYVAWYCQYLDLDFAVFLSVCVCLFTYLLSYLLLSIQ